MKKIEAISLLNGEGWSKADAERALEGLNFSKDPDEFAIYKHISLFAGKELISRQRLQAAQKGMVTKKVKEIDLKETEKLNLQDQAKVLDSQNIKLVKENVKLTEVKDELQKENRSLKEIIDKFRLRVAIEGGKLLQYEDSEIRKALARWVKGIQG